MDYVERKIVLDRDTAVITFRNLKEKKEIDIEVPLNITANELVVGLNEALSLNINTSDIKDSFLKAENPLVLLKGNRTLDELGVRNGTIINYTE